MSESLILSRLRDSAASVGRAWTESAFNTRLSGLFDRISDAAAQSIIGRALHRESTGAVYEESAFFRALERMITGVVEKCSGAFGRFAADAESSGFIGLWRRTLGRLGIGYGTLLGLFFFCMFCCPGQMWSNIYALAGAFGLLCVLFFVTMAKKRPVLRPASLGLGFVLFVIATLAAVLTASDRGDAMRVFIFFATAFMLMILVAASLTDAAKIRQFMAFVFAAVMLTSVYGIYQRIVGVAINESLTDVYANAGMPGRVFSTFENPNNYAEFLVLTVPLCAAFALSCKTAGGRFLGCCCLVLPVGALLMTYSRSGWISFALAVLVFVFIWDKRFVAPIIVAGILTIPLMGETVINRILTIGSKRDSSTMYRVYIWQGALGMLRRYFATGIGLGPASFKTAYLEYANQMALNAVHSHMLYLELWLETGFIGLASFMTFIVGLVKKSALSVKRASSPAVRLALTAGVASFCGIAFSAAVEYIWYYPRVLFAFFSLAGLCVAAVNIVRAEADGAAPETEK
jgi:putative inorganic carbon (HCO3(-)) transporter